MDGMTKRILFVDDDPLVVRIYQDALARKGFQVDAAHDGLAATRALRAGKPDLLILDLMMPKLSGVDVLKFVRSQPELSDLPVVVLSNSYMNDLAQGAAVAGAQKALLKVRCTPSILLGVIRELLEGQPANQEAVLTATPEAPLVIPPAKPSLPPPLAMMPQPVTPSKVPVAPGVTQ